MLDSTFRDLVLRVFDGIRIGRLRLVMPDGGERVFGDASAGPEARIDVRHASFFRRVCLGGDIGFGEAYMHGDFDTPDLTALLRLFIDNPQLTRDDAVSTSRFVRFLNRLLHWRRRNTVRRSKDNITAHYDLGNDFYALFLDPSMTYSCALFRDEQDCITTGQHHKLGAIADIADIQPGDRVLEIGSGWGSFAAKTAAERDARVEGITLSPSQLEWANRLAAERGLADRVHHRICDYRHAEGSYDRLASIEMLEAVGPQYLQAYFDRCAGLLRSGGRMALQVITIPDERYASYRASCDWIQKHIFPGGFLPSVQAMREAVHRVPGLAIDRLDHIGDHYARTLREWRARFHANWERIRPLGFDTLFRRTWDYYLSYCEAGFASRFIHVVQMGLAKS